MIVCEKCNIDKNEELFSKKSKICKKCKSKDSYDNFRKNNPDKMREYGKKYYDKNRDLIVEKNTDYYINNKDIILEKKKNYHLNNKEYILNQKKEYYNLNKEMKSKYNKTYYLENRDKIVEKSVEYKKLRMKNDVLYRFNHIVRGLISSSFYRKKVKKDIKTEHILGCSFDEFKLYIESKFETWMNWDNRGLYNGELNFGWDLDHIIPISSAKTEEEILILNHYTNFQPLCSYTNRYIKKSVNNN